MCEQCGNRLHLEEEPERRQVARAPAAPAATGLAGRALGLQRAAGNRATAQTLARWAAHPDPEQKGLYMADESAATWMRFNPPKAEG